MNKIIIEVSGSINIVDIYTDEARTTKVPEKLKEEILGELQSGSLCFTLSKQTIIEFLDFKPLYWCSIEAGDDLEYQFTK